MAWYCSGATNQEMVSKLKEAGILSTDRAEAAMLAVDRGKYCHEPNPYLDLPRTIGYNVTISAPHMHAYALSILSDQLFDGAKALDVGSGSGYLSACMAFMVGPRGRVIAIDHIPELIEMSTKNVSEDCPHFLKEGRIKFIVGDGRLGYAADGPYNAIHVGAAAETLPQQIKREFYRCQAVMGVLIVIPDPYPTLAAIGMAGASSAAQYLYQNRTLRPDQSECLLTLLSRRRVQRYVLECGPLREAVLHLPLYPRDLDFLPPPTFPPISFSLYPTALIDQLSPGGRLICPVTTIQGYQRLQDLLQVDKNADGTIAKKKLMHVSYVPLTDAEKQLLNH